jgi:flagellar hook-basal body complex protein FliE
MMVPGVGALDFFTRLGTSDGTVSSPGSAPAIGGPASFASALQDVATRTIGTLENAETLSVKALRGEAETREVVDAVMNAEQTMQTAIAIRDKIVSAYLEISRMAI